MRIGTIGNYYGGLHIKKQKGKFFWGIEDHSETRFEEIPKDLFEKLKKYENGKK